MGLVNSIASWALRKRIWQIELFIRHPMDTQLEVFHNLISYADSTEWGKKFHYREIDSIKKFQERVPVSGYEQLFPEIDRMLRGEKNILWPGEVKWFSKSSGTTNDKSKFIPVTKESFRDCHFKCGKDMAAIYLHNRSDSQLFTGKGLTIGGSHEINKYSEKSFYGDLSAVLIENMPVFFEFFRTPDKRVALMGEWEKKIDAMARQVINENVTSISGVPTWTLVLINKIFELTESTDRNLYEIWPNLEVFFHGGLNFRPYRSQFESMLPGDKIRYFETYNASEGFFGLQNEKDKDDLLLMLDYGVFYEFIPLEEVGNPFPKAYTIDETKPGETYAMVISTNGGLWRYLIGDTVTITSRDPYKIRIAGRTKHFINAFGEELMVDSAETAIATACRICQCELENFTVAPVYINGLEAGAHEWLIEFKKEPNDYVHFTEIIDNTLKSLNSDYEAKRYRNMAIQMPIIKSLPRGTFYQWMKSKGKLGGQNKVPRLFNGREYADEILAMIHSRDAEQEVRK